MIIVFKILLPRSFVKPCKLIYIHPTKVFGAYCTSAWYYRHEANKPTMSFFGKGETFVFSLSPRVKRYQWVALTGGDQNATDLFQAGDENMLIVGSG